LDIHIIVNKVLSLRPRYGSSPLVRSFDRACQAARIFLPSLVPASKTDFLDALLKRTTSSSYTRLPDETALISNIAPALHWFANLREQRNGRAALPKGPKHGPRFQLGFWCCTVALAGLQIGMHGLAFVTITLRPGENSDVVRSSLRDVFETRCLVPFVDAGAIVAGQPGSPPHLHLIVLARMHAREWLALHDFLGERNRRSGNPTSAQVEAVYDLNGLMAPKAKYDPLTNRTVGQPGYLMRDCNLTRPGSAPSACQLVRDLENGLLAGGPAKLGELSRQFWTLKAAARSWP
jgi:hypothetical protein